MNQNVLQHFRKDEAPYLDYCSGLCNQALNQYRPILTSFLNPRQVYLLTVITNSYSGINVKFFGGHLNAEMKRGLIYPEYFQPTNRDFKITLFGIKYPSKFVHLKHSQILGTLMSSGIKRNVIGDIDTDDHQWQFFTKSSMATYLKFQITKINRNRVMLQALPLSDAIEPTNDWQDKYSVVVSLRLDAIISAGFNVSRNQSKDLIKHNHVRLNWELVNQPNLDVQINDILSVRQYGRLKLKTVKGRSRKGKLRIVISVIKK